MCRSLKVLPNEATYSLLAQNLDPGFDGEGVTIQPQDLFGDGQVHLKPFYQIQSDLMSVHGVPDFRYYVFGCHVIKYRQLPYIDMVQCLHEWDAPDWVVKVLPTKCDTLEELQAYMAKCVADGHEGCCFRVRCAPNWKNSSADGRSTLREQWLVKWKLFHEAEATVIGFEEEMQNNNEATLDLRGLQVRSSHQQNLVGKRRLGALVCRTVEGVEFKMGSGFTTHQRQDLWDIRETLPGKLATYKSQQYGEKEAPRIPIFKAIRDPIDIS